MMCWFLGTILVYIEASAFQYVLIVVWKKISASKLQNRYNNNVVNVNTLNFELVVSVLKKMRVHKRATAYVPTRCRSKRSIY